MSPDKEIPKITPQQVPVKKEERTSPGPIPRKIEPPQPWPRPKK